jgi:hypothetical protein
MSAELFASICLNRKSANIGIGRGTAPRVWCSLLLAARPWHTAELGGDLAMIAAQVAKLIL